MKRNLRIPPNDALVGEVEYIQKSHNKQFQFLKRELRIQSIKSLVDEVEYLQKSPNKQFFNFQKGS